MYTNAPLWHTQGRHLIWSNTSFDILLIISSSWQTKDSGWSHYSILNLSRFNRCCRQ